MHLMKRLQGVTRHTATALMISLLAVALSVPPLRRLIEQSMVWHMVIQLPMLALGGWLCLGALLSRRASERLAPWNRYGLTGFIAAQGIVAYWMLPLAIDRAVVLALADVTKLLSCFVCGALLKHSVQRAPLAVQLFFVGTTVSMMIWLGTYFATTDRRLCNAYSLQSQIETGWGLVLLGVALGGIWLIHAIFRTPGDRERRLF